MVRLAVAARRWIALSVLLFASSGLAATPLDRVRVDLEALIRAGASSPSQFAVPVPHPVSTANAGTWTQANGRATWHYTVQVPTAVSLSFHATRARLPDDATLIVRGKSTTAIYRSGSVHKGELWSRISTGDVLDFTLDVPLAQRSGVVLEIASFQAGYRGLGRAIKDHPYFRRMKASALAVSSNDSCAQNYRCNVTSANTPAGQATVGVLVGNLYQCTGTLLNDVPGDSIPYVLTARHCQTGSLGGGNPGAAGTVAIYWNAISACGQPLGTLYDPGIQVQVGATTIVEQQDAWLIRLDANPVVTDAQFAGFDASGAAVTGGYTIHHALGFDKQFTRWHGRAAIVRRSNVLGVTYVSDFLETINEFGNIGPGASGSGLFDQNHHFVGVLSLGRVTDDDSEYGACPSSNPPAPNGSNGAADFTSLPAIWDSTADTTSTTGPLTLKSVLDPQDTGTLVVPSARAATVTFTASRENPEVGQSVELSWNVPEATQCTASGGTAGDGWSGVLGASGTRPVSEVQAGILGYKLTCALPGGRSISASVFVTWGELTPHVDFSAPTEVWTTTPARLTWSSNASPCSITGGSLLLTDLPASGSVTTTQDTPGDVLYLISCGARANPATAGVVVYYVTPSVIFQANGTDRRLGEHFFLEWSTNASACVHTGGAPNDGWATFDFSGLTRWTFAPDVSTLGTYTYTLTCSSGALSISKSVEVTLEDDPPYVEASIDKVTVQYALDPPNLFTMSWKSNLSQCDPASVPDIGQIHTRHYPDDTGSVEPWQPGTYDVTLTCFDVNGIAAARSAPLRLTVTPPPPPVVAISITPDHVETGQVFTVAWSSTDARQCSGTGGTPDGIWDPVIPIGSQGWLSSTPGEFRFAISCHSIADGVPDGEAEAVVTVVSPTPPTATLESSASTIEQGKSFTLTWSSTHASECAASGGGASGSIWTGSLATSGSVTEAADRIGAFTYTMTCGNGVQTTQAQTHVTVSAPAKKGGGGNTDLASMVLLLAALAIRKRIRDVH